MKRTPPQFGRTPSRRTLARRSLLPLSASALLLAALTGCGSSDETGQPDPTPPLFTTEASLAAFASCDDLDGWLTELATNHIADSLAGGWGGGRGGVDFGFDDAVSAPEAGGDNGAGGEGPSDFTETNVQEEGVDEPDILKTDGQTLYVLSGRMLHIMKSWPAEELELLSSVELPSQDGAQMLRVGTRLIVMSSVYDYSGEWGGEGRPGPGLDMPSDMPPSLGFTGTRVQVINAADPSNPQVESTWDFQSNYVNARTVEGTVYLVASSNAHTAMQSLWRALEADESYAPPTFNGDEQSAEAREDYRNRVRDYVRPLVARWVAETGRDLLLPDVRADEGEWDELFACNDIYRPAMQAGSSIMSVVAIDPEGAAAPNGAGVLAEGWQVYGSTQSLYLAQDSRWWWFPTEDDRTVKTHIHRFALNDGQPRYASSGSVDGWLLNQFSMSEYEGHLRVATTDATTWGGGMAVDSADAGTVSGGDSVEPAEMAPETDGSPAQKRILQVGEPDVQANNLFVLRESAGALEVVGGIRGLAPEERIYSARFIGPKAYVVTFRETDPLYTFDLSNPEEPQVLGELKIPGFSTYLHPFGEDHLIGVGRDGDDDGRIFGVQLQLFDVSDPTDPQRTHRVVIDQGDGWSSSEAEYDHRAFTFFARSNLLALPITLQDYNAPEGPYRHFSGMIVYRVSVDNGFEEVGRVSHSGLARDAYCERMVTDGGISADGCSWEYGWWTSMRRSVFADDWFYAISTVGVTVSPADAPADVAATVEISAY